MMSFYNALVDFREALSNESDFMLQRVKTNQPSYVEK